MPNFTDDFIELDRTFHELTVDADATDQTEMNPLMGTSRKLHWPDLLARHRVVLLSEAGSGKTREVKQVALRLRGQGLAAFFLRIESVANNFVTSFEVGTHAEFQAWCASGEEGWLLLDSVDEARLHDPKDFERAIKIIGCRLGSVMHNAHIVITGRSTAWRAKTDLLLCRQVFPFQEPQTTANEIGEDTSSAQVKTMRRADSREIFAPFQIVALDDLEGAQINEFLLGKGVVDVASFLDGVERKDVLSLMSRPQDLSELADYWKAHGHIGSRLELLQDSIQRRLTERDQDRAEARPIAAEKVRLGARLIAAGTTLTQNATVQVPDGTANPAGLAVRQLLDDWDEKDCATLLQRPVFEPGIYGTVRFHHRSVREYLTAEWLHHLLEGQAPRLRIEELFFRSQYGIEVVVPTMRPILPWLAVLYPPILERITRLAPEILFEGGDPSKLDRNTRIKILRQACEQLAQPARTQSLSNYAAVQRFADEDLTDVIKELLAQHAANADISWFLLRMVWRGEIVGALPEAKALALSCRTLHTRIAAFRALHAIGSKADLAEVRLSFLEEDHESPREWVAELMTEIPHDAQGIDWVLKALARVSEKKRYDTDNLIRVLSQQIYAWPQELLPRLLNGLHALLQEPPLLERINHSVSRRYAWLVKCVSLLVSRLLSERDSALLGRSGLSILGMLPVLSMYGNDFELDDPVEDLVSGVPKWKELNHALFWHEVEHVRRQRQSKGERLTDHWSVGSFHAYWRFTHEDFELILEDVRSRPELDDRLVAQSLAFLLYRQANRPVAWRNRMKRLAKCSAELEAAFHLLLHPPANGMAQLRKQDAQFKRRFEARRAKQEIDKEKSKVWLLAHLDSVRGQVASGVPTPAQYYLHQHIREKDHQSGKWSDGHWQSLTGEFGERVAQAYRDGALGFWRKYKPVLRSEGAEEGSTPFALIFGLTGLAIESSEDSEWPRNLSCEEVNRATRYALLELNGFSSWLPALFSKHPRVVLDVVIHEVDYELEHESPEGASRYLISDLAWSGQWLWNDLAPHLVKRVGRFPRTTDTLGHLLAILHGSALSNEVVAELATPKARSTKNTDTCPLWFASWVGVAPQVAIPALAAHLAEMTAPSDQTRFAMRFVTALVGGRRNATHAREAYRTVAHMKALYLLMHQYIRVTEDVDRAGKGVYSPDLRDDAQDARNALISFIKETPGKEAYLAMMELSALHPAETSRPWIAYRAKEKAIADADTAPWTVDQVISFHRNLERTPASHRDLWYLAIDHLRDLAHDLENSDTSIASTLLGLGETEVRKVIGNACRERGRLRYSVSQESELADSKMPDIQFHRAGMGSVPCELKLAESWTGPSLFERLEVQLCGDYLRDRQSNRGIFLMVYGGGKQSWIDPNGNPIKGFLALVEALQEQWSTISPRYPEVEDIRVIGIDLTKRGIDTKTRLTGKARKARKTSKAVKSAGKKQASSSSPSARRLS